MKKTPKKPVKKILPTPPAPAREKKSFRGLFILFVVIVLAIISLWAHWFGPRTLHIQTPDGIVSLRVERALTSAQQQKGLMFRSSLGEKEGMIFLFPSNRVAHMWMKNTLIPLDMIFFDKEGNVVSIYHNAQPLDLKLISSITPVAGVLEINGGASKELGIDVRSKLDLDMVK